ncbi:Prostatic acid phosphatase [Porphyridium purpureum]|uniref:Prostatic acid phosphatase n=1 Tax=Porphyridium purpureum TaxID=35688 RepID=A0A5J4YS21_PORPP|nr:Prostatic acid phosphatase [Porphyridium purpureum]|eukprot:POR7265..scf296_7
MEKEARGDALTSPAKHLNASSRSGSGNSVTFDVDTSKNDVIGDSADGSVDRTDSGGKEKEKKKSVVDETQLNAQPRARRFVSMSGVGRSKSTDPKTLRMAAISSLNRGGNDIDPPGTLKDSKSGLTTSMLASLALDDDHPQLTKTESGNVRLSTILALHDRGLQTVVSETLDKLEDNRRLRGDYVALSDAEREKQSKAIYQMIIKLARVKYDESDMTSLREAFSMLDPHSYGYLPAYKFRQLLDSPDRPAGRVLSAFQKDLLVEIADEDGNQKIDYNEYVSIMNFMRRAQVGEENSSTLRMAIVITRHGARFPLKPFPKSTAWPKNKLFWETYGGKLTPVGHRQHQEVGAMLGDHYIKSEGFLVPDMVDFSSRVYAYTSNSDRTVGSAQSLLVGMFPQNALSFAIEETAAESEKLSETVEQQAEGIVLRIADMTQEYTPKLHGFKSNRAYAEMKKRALAESVFFKTKAEDPEYLKLLDKLWAMTEFKKISPDLSVVERLQHFQSAAQQIAIERAYKIHVFSNSENLFLDREDEERIREVSDYICRVRYQGLDDNMQREMARLAAGTLPLEITSKFRSAIDNTSNFEFCLYSAHDNTIMALLAQLGFRDWPIPQFAAHVVFELHYEETLKDYFVRIAYNPDPRDLQQVSDYEWFHLPPHREIFDFSETAGSCKGSMTFTDFALNLMMDRQSFRSVEEWKQFAGEPGDSDGE